MLTFDAPLFAMAGLAAAAGPILVHLLNRRRFRVVAWGAMDFLREAMQRHRQSLELRDLLLLMLRMLVVCLLGVALARPYLQGSSTTGVFSAGLWFLLVLGGIFAAAAAVLARGARERWIAGSLAGLAFLSVLGFAGWNAVSARAGVGGAQAARSPVHAVLVVDNSRSMGVVSTSGTRLDRARQMARKFLDDLPPDSKVTLIPAAGSLQPFALDPYTNLSDAQRGLDELALVDSADEIAAALDLAERACQQVTDPDLKRVVVLSDLQSPAWKQFDWPGWSQRLPGLQVAPVSEGGASNLAVESLGFEDGFAGAEAAGRFLARVRAAGLIDKTSVTATLTVDGVVIGSQALELENGQTRELEFGHRFEVGGEPGRPNWSRVTLELQPETSAADRLPADDSRTILVPVLDAVPVVFIDELGDREQPARQQIGETYALRHLLAPRIADDDSPRRLIHVSHVAPGDVTQELLESARLVVVAGVESPQGLTTLLRDYVVQGGPLVLLAGGNFDPAAWQVHGWLDGRGILPCPIESEWLGHLPNVGDSLQTFFVDRSSLSGRDFVVEGEDPEILQEIFESTPFFQAVRADVGPLSLSTLRTAETEYWTRELAKWNAAAADAQGDSAAAARERQRQLEPAWWNWRSPIAIYPATLTAEQIVEREQPRVLAKYTADGWPWIVERRLGRGSVLFFTSGVTSDWNLLRSSGAMYVFHRLLFRLMADTLPERNPTAGQRITFPIAAAPESRWEVRLPNGRKDLVSAEILESNTTGVVLRRTVLSGLYELRPLSSSTAEDVDASLGERPPLAVWAVQGPAAESELNGASVSELRTQVGDLPIAVLGVGEPIRLEGGARRGERLWQWSLLGVLLGLAAEMVLLGNSQVKRGAA